MAKNDKKKGKNDFFQVFSCFECKKSKKYEIEGAPAPEIAYFYTTTSFKKNIIQCRIIMNNLEK